MTKHALFAALVIALTSLISRPGISQTDSACAQKHHTPLTVLTASSLYHALNSLDKERLCQLGIKLRLISAASSTLTQQIEHGFEADIFISANANWMEHLAKNDRLAPHSRTIFLGNTLVKVHLEDRPEVIKWTTGDPSHVPLGLYAKEALINMGEWDALEPKLVPAMNARAAVALMNSGAVDMAVLYKSDTLAHLPDTLTATPIAPETHSPIQYEGVVLASSQNAESARAFLNHLRSPDVQNHFETYGFMIIEPVSP
ncbi:MAG: molybdate ABC transporter substrate-binding protein [Sphingomonadales bacterium]|nr:molybdate ABC transporter substrate-binding protein [Sphingomonadales bacterium]